MLRWYRDLLNSDVLSIAAMSFGMLAGMSAYAVANSPSAVWAWSLFIVLLAPFMATGLPWLARTGCAPDRLPASLDDKTWQLIVAIILASFSAGAWNLIDGDPNTTVWGAVVAFAFGGLGTALVVRHLRKPIRPSEPRQTPDDWREDPSGWRLPNRRTPGARRP
jgi:hypothetical protein